MVFVKHLDWFVCNTSTKAEPHAALNRDVRQRSSAEKPEKVVARFQRNVFYYTSAYRLVTQRTLLVHRFTHTYSVVDVVWHVQQCVYQTAPV